MSVSQPVLSDVLNEPLRPAQRGKGAISKLLIKRGSFYFCYDSDRAQWRPILRDHDVAPRTLADAKQLTKEVPKPPKVIEALVGTPVTPDAVGRWPLHGRCCILCRQRFAYDVQQAQWRPVLKEGADWPRIQARMRAEGDREAAAAHRKKRQTQTKREGKRRAEQRRMAFASAVQRSVAWARGGLSAIWSGLSDRGKQVVVFLGIPALVVIGFFVPAIHYVFGGVGLIMWVLVANVLMSGQRSEVGGPFAGLMFISVATFGVAPAIFLFFSVFAVRLLFALF